MTHLAFIVDQVYFLRHEKEKNKKRERKISRSQFLWMVSQSNPIQFSEYESSRENKDTTSEIEVDTMEGREREIDR